MVAMTDRNLTPAAQDSGADHAAMVAATRLDNPFVAMLGFEVGAVSTGRAELHYAPKAEHLNVYAVAHGGATMTLLDATMAAAARSHPPHMGVVTVEMKTSFMQPASGRLKAVAEVLHRTATLAFTHGTVYNESGAVCAHATATFKYLRQLPVGRQLVSQKILPPEVAPGA